MLRDKKNYENRVKIQGISCEMCANLDISPDLNASGICVKKHKRFVNA